MSQKISALPAAASAIISDQHEVNQGGISKRLTNAQIATFIETGLSQVILSGTGTHLNSDGSAQFSSGGIVFNAVGSASFGGGTVTLSFNGDSSFSNGVIIFDNTGTATFLSNIVFQVGIILLGNGASIDGGTGNAIFASVDSTSYNAGGTPGITQDVTVLTALPSTFATLHFKSGLLVSVT